METKTDKDGFIITTDFEIGMHTNGVKKHYSDNKYLEQIAQIKNLLVQYTKENPDVPLIDMCALFIYGNLSMTIKNMNIKDNYTLTPIKQRKTLH